MRVWVASTRELENGATPIAYGDQEYEAWLDLYHMDGRDHDQMGELITVGRTQQEAIENMIGFTQTLGYDGRLYFVDSFDTNICHADLSGEKAKITNINTLMLEV